MLPFRGQILSTGVKQEQYKDVRLGSAPFRLTLWTRLYAINTIFLKSFSLLYPLILVSGITIRRKIYECERKGGNTAPVQKRVNYENKRRQNAPLLACTGLRCNEIR